MEQTKELDETSIDTNLQTGVGLLMQETNKLLQLINTAKTTTKKKYFSNKLEKVKKEIRMLLYMQHLRSQQDSVVEENSPTESTSSEIIKSEEV